MDCENDRLDRQAEGRLQMPRLMLRNETGGDAARWISRPAAFGPLRMMKAWFFLAHSRKQRDTAVSRFRDRGLARRPVDGDGAGAERDLPERPVRPPPPLRSNQRRLHVAMDGAEVLENDDDEWSTDL